MRYIIYARKSTEDEDRQILSVEAQLFELRQFADKEKLEIVASFEEAKTAKEPGRIKLREVKPMAYSRGIPTVLREILWTAER